MADLHRMYMELESQLVQSPFAADHLQRHLRLKLRSHREPVLEELAASLAARFPIN
jgi:hypothetical protein